MFLSIKLYTYTKLKCAEQFICRKMGLALGLYAINPNKLLFLSFFFLSFFLSRCVFLHYVLSFFLFFYSVLSHAFFILCSHKGNNHQHACVHARVHIFCLCSMADLIVHVLTSLIANVHGRVMNQAFEC